MGRFGRENWDNTKFVKKKIFFSPQPTDMEEKGFRKVFYYIQRTSVPSKLLEYVIQKNT